MDFDRQETRNRILDAATRVVNEIGFQKATIDIIIREANISKGGFLHYFKTKHACFLAVIDRCFERILDTAHERYPEIPPGPARMLKAYITAWLEWQNSSQGIPVMGVFEEHELCKRLMEHRIRHYELVIDGSIPTLTVQTVLLLCAGLWTTPSLADTTQEEFHAFSLVMRQQMFDMIDQANATQSANPDA